MEIFQRIARATVVFITLGALTIVWSGVWLAYLLNNGEGDRADPGASLYVAIGFLLTGVVLIAIGALMAVMGRRPAEHEMELEEKTAEAAARCDAPVDTNVPPARDHQYH